MRAMAGKTFDRLCKDAHISLMAISKESGVSYATVWKYANEITQTRYSTRDKCLFAYVQLKGKK